MNFSEAYQHTIQSIKAIYGEEEARAIAKLLFEEKYGLKSLSLSNNEPFIFETELNTVIKRLQQHEPLQYIIGHAYFYGLKIAVDQNVLIPRPETEELVALAKNYINDSTAVIADICTGSGCIAVAMHALFKDKNIIATDISIGALETATANASLNFNTPVIQFEQHDILTQSWPFAMPDIVICNPPYIARKEADTMEENVMQYEPHLALFVEDDDALLFYKAVIQTFLPVTFPILCFEINPLLSRELADYCMACKLNCEIKPDMQGKERFAVVSKSFIE